MDDIDAILADLEARLRELQADLGAETEPIDTEPGDTEPGDTEPGDTEPGDTERRHGRPGVEHVETRSAQGDPLDAFGERLRRATAELVRAYDDAVGQARGGDGGLFDADVALEARADLPGLCALAAALRRVEAVVGVELRAYAGGHAVLDVVLDRPVALLAELQTRGAPPLAVLKAASGRLVVAVGPGKGP